MKSTVRLAAVLLAAAVTIAIPVTAFSQAARRDPESPADRGQPQHRGGLEPTPGAAADHPPARSANTPAAEPLIERGRYLAIAADCAACHTVPERAPLSGGLAMASPFGTIWSTNITPDPEHGIGKYTEAEFTDAMRHGIRRDGSRLYPAMPYTSFVRMTDDDIHALYAYLKNGVAPEPSTPRQQTDLAFPFNQRWGIRLWNLVFAPSGVFKPDDSKDEQWNRGAWLVQGPGHCGECHTERGLFGQLTTYDRTRSSYLAGGDVGDWHAPSLRGAGSGRNDTSPARVVSWTRDEMLQYLRAGRNRHGGVTGEMGLVVGNSLSAMRENDRAAIVDYLSTLSPPDDVSPVDHAALETERVKTERVLKAGNYGTDSGERLYMDNCAACHFGTGRGAGDVFPPLAGNTLVNAPGPDALLHVILSGAVMPSTASRPERLRMPGFAWRLSDDEVAQLATFVRGSWGNKSKAVTARDAAQVRKTLDEAEKHKP